MTTLVTDIKLLAGVRESEAALRGEEIGKLPVVENAFLIIEDGIIADFGTLSSAPRAVFSIRNQVNASGQAVLPCWCDSHTHLVFASGRENEFIGRIKGLSYEEIAAGGGGILNSAKTLHEMSEDELFNLAWDRLMEISKLGTGAVEIKSGYGLSVEGELKMLRVIKRLKSKSPVSIKSTFLGAHAYPQEFRHNHPAYIDCVVNEMLPMIAKEKLADYIDVFCETGFFSVAEMETVCNAGKSHGLKPRLHVNQLNSIGGLQAGIKLNAISVDHLESLTTEDIRDLAASKTIATLLPTAAFFLRTPFPPARKLLDAGAAVALASDFNPGSSPSGNMNVVVALACIQMKMFPGEAINAATLNGAFAMGLGTELGSIAIGKKANLIFTKPVSSLESLPYYFGTNLVDKVMIGGETL